MFGKREPLLERLESEYADLYERARALARVGPDAYNRRPSDDRWSAAECVDHLIVSVRLYQPVLTEAVDRALADGPHGDRPDGRTLLGRVICWTMEPPSRFKMTTFSELEPASEHEPEAHARAFEEAHEELLSQLRRAGDVDGKRVKVRSTLDDRLKLSLDDWFAFMASHGRRHLWQAEQALKTDSAV